MALPFLMFFFSLFLMCLYTENTDSQEIHLLVSIYHHEILYSAGYESDIYLPSSTPISPETSTFTN